MMKKINVQNDVESRCRIAEALPKRKMVQEIESIEKEVVNAQSEEVPEHPVVEAAAEPEAPKKGRRKATGNA